MRGPFMHEKRYRNRHVIGKKKSRAQGSGNLILQMMQGGRFNPSEKK